MHAGTNEPAARPLILVAEDNRMSRLLMAEQLALLGFDAEVVGNGREALDRWRSGRIAVVLTDLQMPELDGYALTQAIRREEGDGAHTPVIALSASALHEGSNRWQEVGIDDYLTKPAEMAALQTMLERWLRPAGAVRPPPGRETRSVGDASVGDAPVDLQVLAEMVGHDDATLRSFLDDFARAAAEGATALELALGRGHPEQAGFIAHQLKASARSVGSLRLGRHCAAIEEAAARSDDPALAAACQLFQAELALVQRWILEHRALTDRSVR